MYQRILVAVDGSDTGQRALEQAIQLARTHRAQLRIAHVVNEVTLDWNYSDFTDIDAVQEQFRKAGRRILDEAMKAASAAGVAADVKLLEIETRGHHIAELIASEADAWPADVIVVGTHGRRGVRRLLLGSVAERIARVASKPVVLIPGA